MIAYTNNDETQATKGMQAINNLNKCSSLAGNRWRIEGLKTLTPSSYIKNSAGSILETESNWDWSKQTYVF